jgi:hypothetical protein
MGLFTLFCREGASMDDELSQDQQKTDIKRSALLRPYNPDFSIANISEKYSENDMIGYSRKNLPKEKTFFINKWWFYLKKIFKK